MKPLCSLIIVIFIGVNYFGHFSLLQRDSLTCIFVQGLLAANIAAISEV